MGCSGGFGAGLRTTSFLWDTDVLIDAGTGVGDLMPDELSKIDHIFLTHSHLDHIVSIPFLADAIVGKRASPITIHGLPETLAALHEKIFHNLIWPDFTTIPNLRQPCVQLSPMQPGQEIAIGQKSVTSIAVNHVVPAVGYLLRSAPGNHLAFSGDTSNCPTLWRHLQDTPNLHHVIVECSFRDSEIELAKVSKHFCPSLLAKDLEAFSSPAKIHISHTKPGESDTVMQEINALAPIRCGKLSQGDILEF